MNILIPNNLITELGLKSKINGFDYKRNSSMAKRE